MSRARQALTVEQEPFLAVRSLECNYSSRFVIQPHKHDWQQLLYASAGAMTVQAGRVSWMIPSGKAVFIPAGYSHSIRMWGEVSMRSLAFPLKFARSELTEECRVITVTPLLRELILRIVSMSALDSREAAHNHLYDLLLDEIVDAPVAPLMLGLPADPRALALARKVLSCPGNNDSLDKLSCRFACGRRTLERLFQSETGMSFGLWRQKVRLVDAVRLLSEGKTVTEAAFDSGYNSVSAFITAFKRTFGCTPGRL